MTANPTTLSTRSACSPSQRGVRKALRTRPGYPRSAVTSCRVARPRRGRSTVVQQSTWPESLWIVRHGESSGNVARDRAEAEQLEVIDIAERDVDVPLSDLGKRQAEALGHWTAEQPEDERPT